MLLVDHHRLEQEYQRRLNTPALRSDEMTTTETQITRARQGIERLIDGYTAGYIQKHEFEPRISRLRQRLADLEAQAQQLTDELALQQDLRLIITRLEEFASVVTQELGQADWTTRRDLIRALVRRVEIGTEQVNVVFRVPPVPFESSPIRGILQHCWQGHFTPLRCPAVTRTVLPRFHCTCFEAFMDEVEQSSIMNISGQDVHQYLMVKIIKRAKKLIPPSRTQNKTK